MGVLCRVSRCLCMASRINALHRPHLSLPSMQIGVGLRVYCCDYVFFFITLSKTFITSEVRATGLRSFSVLTVTYPAQEGKGK